MTLALPFQDTYRHLPAEFFTRLDPAPIAAPSMIRLNTPLARALGLDPARLAGAEGVAILGGARVAEGSAPIAQVYAGHQFGGFSPQLGDGRALLLGELLAPDGRRFDLQLKGSGRTPYSRGGDGRAALGPMLREYLVSEAMAALGVPTTRALSVVATGEVELRERPLPGAVLARVAASHLRVGTFQFFAARGDTAAVKTLADYAIARHDPALTGDYRGFLAAVIARQAALIARWMLLGFVHGVMNTDNMTISGETIDYGPCAFMEGYDPATVFSSIDHYGRYAYANQPRMAQWNLTRLAEALLPLLAEETEAAKAIAVETLGGFGPAFQRAWSAGLLKKLGLASVRSEDAALVEQLLELMQAAMADFTLSFRRLAEAAEGETALLLALLGGTPEAAAWIAAWRERLAAEGDAASRAAALRAANPIYIPRNHLVEEALTAAEQGNTAPFEALAAVLADPFTERPGLERYATPAREEERVLATFCGT